MCSVYLVDDEKLLLDNIVDMIEWQENNLELVGMNTDPQKALKEIVALSPDIVFCDLKMPTMSGIDLVRCCKENGVGAEFIMLSAFAEFEASRDFFLLGGHDYLLKPIDADSLQLTLENLLQKINDTNGSKKEKTILKSTTAFSELISYIETNYHQKHTLKSLSEKFHISETYICDLFSKNHSTTFTLFIGNIRMKKAAELIMETDTPMKQICRMCGYPDYLYFCRVFKNYHGVTPSKYREHRHEN